MPRFYRDGEAETKREQIAGRDEMPVISAQQRLIGRKPSSNRLVGLKLPTFGNFVRRRPPRFQR
jgi:hypothetical protein